jgi:acyl dehydratase
VTPPIVRRFEVTDERIRAYSRRGNYHSEPETAREIGLPGLVAQGVQVVGPAYGVLLDAWGEEFLARGALDVRFVGMVLAGDTVEARVDVDEPAGTATIEVDNAAAGRTAAIGEARRSVGAAE